MKYILTLLISFILSFSFSTVNSKVLDLTSEEDFDEFLETFSIVPEFQISRIIFPFLDCSFPDGKDSHCDTIAKAKWRHLALIDTTKKPMLITKTYDNFKLEMKDSGERVLSYSAVSTNICSLYFFKRINGKWYLIKRLVCEG